MLTQGKVRKIGMHYFFLTGDIEGHSLGSLRSFYGSDDNPQKYQSDRLRPTTSLPRGLSSSLHQVGKQVVNSISGSGGVFEIAMKDI